MSSQEKIPQTMTTMEAAFTLHESPELQAEFWKHQERMGPIAAASAGFISVIGGPMHRSHWLYFCGKWETPMLMDAWQRDFMHVPMQQAAHSRWFSSIYIRKWRVPAAGEKLEGPLLCEVAIARQEALSDDTVNQIIDECIHPSLREHEPLAFETLTKTYEKQPFQFVGPIQEYPPLAPARYLLLTHWATEDALRHWLRPVLDSLSPHGEVTFTISVQIKHDQGERDYLRSDGLQREAIHA